MNQQQEVIIIEKCITCNWLTEHVQVEITECHELYKCIVCDRELYM